jgi:hypothetical protein
MTHTEACKVLKEKNWAAQSNWMGNLFAVGVEVEDGSLNVLGMAPTFTEAVDMALRSEVKK